MADLTMPTVNGSGKPAHSENEYTFAAQGKFEQSFIDKVKERNPLEFVVGQSVELRRSGPKTQSGLCPFHVETTPSFSTYGDHFHCFGCKAHGDVIDFVVRCEGISFQDAVAQLAKRAGMALPHQELQSHTPEDRAAREQERLEHQRQSEERRALAVQQEQDRQAAVAEKAETAWAVARPAPANHPYLARKGIEPHGFRIDDKGKLLVDMRDPEGKLWNLQSINATGEKRFLMDGRTTGLSHVLGGFDGAAGVMVTEGVATGASVHEATKLPVLVAFSASSLSDGVRELRAQFPELPIVVAADNDHRKPENIGLVKAQEAVNDVSNTAILAPTFQPDDESTDWNDYTIAHGHAAVKALLRNAVDQLTAKPAVAKPARASLTLPPGLLDVDGALGEFVAYCQATAISPQPFLALAAGIVAIGALAGRRYRSETNLRTNLYAVGIASSGSGKDHARKRIKTVFAAAGLTRYLGGEDIASGAGMITALQRHPAMLFQIDEFGDWLEGVLGKQAGTHKKQIAQKLKELFSNADSFMNGVEKANQSKDKGTPREDIIQPHACMYGTTTPKQFWDAIAGGSLQDGFLARFLICVSPDNFPDDQEPELIDPPERLIKAFQAIAGGVDSSSGNLASAMASGFPMSAQAEAYPYLVPYEPAAKAAMRALTKEQTAWRKRAKEAHVEATVARWVEHTIKLALLHAVSRDPVRPIISIRDFIWARTFAKHCIDTMLEQVGYNVADNDYERRLNKCMDIARRHGQPITERELIRKGLKLPQKDRAEVLKTLIEAGRLTAEQKEMDGPGRRTTLYAIVNDDENDD